MRARLFPFQDQHLKPLFWSFDQNFSDILNTYERAFSSSGVSASQSAQVKETDQAVLMTLDLPGVKSEHLEIEVENNQLLIKAKRKKFTLEENEEFLHLERTFKLSQEIEVDKIQAHLEDGVLFLALPKIEKAQKKRVEISASKGPEWNRLLAAKEESETKNS